MERSMDRMDPTIEPGAAAEPKDALHRLNRELHAISNCNQVLVRADDEAFLLETICRIVCDEAGYSMAWVGYPAQDDRRSVRIAARGGMDDGFVAAADFTWGAGLRGQGPAGTAIRSGCTDCTQDIAADPRMAPWREAALRRGYRSAIALPLKDQEGAVFGVFEIYSAEPGTFTPNEIRLLEELSGDLAFGIASLRARRERERDQEALRVGEDRYRSLFENSPVSLREEDYSGIRQFLDDLENSGVCNLEAYLDEHPEVIRDGAGNTRIIDVNRAALKLHGATGKEELRDRVTATCAPEWFDTFRKVLVALWSGETSLSDDTVITTFTGDRRYVTASFSVCPGHEKTLSRVLISLVDITNRKRIENTQRFIAQLGWTDASDSFLASLVRHLGETLKVEYVIIDRLSDTPGMAETVALYARGSIVPNMSYVLHGTPCENVMGKRLCYYPRGVQALFPSDSLLVEMGVDSYAGIPLWDASGNGIGLIAVMDCKPFEDEEAITQILQLVAVSAAAFLEREQSLILLKQREQEFRTLANNIPDLIVRYDSTLSRTFVNHAWEEASGLTASEVVNVPAERIPRVPAPVVGEYAGKIRRVLESGVSERAEFSWCNARGETLYLEYLIVPEHDHEGKVAGVLSVGRDITERKRDEQERQAHLRFFERMDRVNRVLQGADSLEGMMGELLDAVLDIFGCDRAFLLYPCDPEAPVWSVPVERSQSACPCPQQLGVDRPMDPEMADTLRVLLANEGPATFGPGMRYPLPEHLSARLGFRSLISMPLYPKVDKPWQFGLHQCSAPRIWTPEEERLFLEIGRRLADGMTALLINHHLQESERRYRLVFENSPVSLWEEDFSEVRFLYDDLRKQGVIDLRSYFQEHPDTVRRCAGLIRIVEVNQAALALHGATSKEELQSGLVTTFLPDSFLTLQQELIALWEGRTEMSLDTVVQTFAGEPRDVTLYFSVCPGYEQSLGKVLVSLTDITDRKRAEKALRELNTDLETRVRKRTAELERKNQELARMNKLFVGRELRMVELKQRIRELEPADGQADPNA